MRLIRVPHVFSFFAPRLSGCVGGCLAICRATIVGLLRFAVLCGAILMGRVDAHAQAPWPSGPVNVNIRAFGNTSEKVSLGGVVVAESRTATETCARTTLKDPAAPCYYCPKKSANKRCVKTRSPAEIATCEVNTDGACTPKCEEDPEHLANRPVVPNNRPPGPAAQSGGSGGGGARCRVTGAAAHYSQCCQDYCHGRCQASGSPCGPWNPPPSNGGSVSNSSGPGTGSGGGTQPCPPGTVRQTSGVCVSPPPPPCPPGTVRTTSGVCVSPPPPPPPPTPRQCEVCAFGAVCCFSRCNPNGGCS